MNKDDTVKIQNSNVCGKNKMKTLTAMNVRNIDRHNITNFISSLESQNEIIY